MIVYKNQILNSVEDRKSTSCFLPISMGTIANSLNLCASMLMLMPLTISLPCLIKPDLFISMIYKRLLSFRLCSLRENEDLFPIRQHAYRKRQATCEALLDKVYAGHSALDRGRKLIMTQIYFSAPIDRVSHSSFLFKMRNMGSWRCCFYRCLRLVMYTIRMLKWSLVFLRVVSLVLYFIYNTPVIYNYSRENSFYVMLRELTKRQLSRRIIYVLLAW